MKEFHLTERLMVGHPVIDGDHQQLVDLVNASTRELSAGNHAVFMELFADLVELTKKHFEREEEILASLGFPNTPAHSHYHLEMQDELEARLMRYEQTGKYDDPQTYFYDMTQFVIHDFVTKDLEFKSFMQEVL